MLGGATPYTELNENTILSAMTAVPLSPAAENPPPSGDAPFCMTYGDGVTDLDIRKVIAFHEAHGKLATVTAVHPPSRFGPTEC